MITIVDDRLQADVIMNGSGKTKARPLQIKRYIFVLIVVWTMVIAVSLFWNVGEVRRNTLEAARIQAGVAYDKDIVYRRWNAMHGGVYVPSTSESPPNPYLTFVEERDITTPSGKKLTLMNPAYMTRQVNELVDDESGVRGHLTSLKPIRPENAADLWETEALKAFERGETEISSVERIEDKEYMRLMRPLITEKGCLKCHAQQGYVEGDIRGGISVSIPMVPLWAVGRERIIMVSSGHILLWLIGMGGIVLGTKRIIRSEGARRTLESELLKHTEMLEQSNNLKDLFADIMSHDFINPSSVILNYADLVLEEELSEEVKGDVKRIKGSAERLIEMIESARKFSKLERIEESTFRETDLRALLEKSIAEFQHLLDEKKMTVIWKSDEKSIASVNPFIGDVFSNLLSNAIKYGPEESKIIVGVEDKVGSALISVTDQAEKIPRKYQNSIFQRFKRLPKESVKGTGLGLAIVKRVVDLHKGRVWVEDNPVGGNIFYVEIPKKNKK